MTVPAGLDPAQLRALFDRAAHPVAAYQGPKHVCIYANPALDRVLSGRPLLGLPLRAALAGVYGENVLACFDRVYRSGAAAAVPERGIICTLGWPQTAPSAVCSASPSRSPRRFGLRRSRTRPWPGCTSPSRPRTPAPGHGRLRPARWTDRTIWKRSTAWRRARSAATSAASSTTSARAIATRSWCKSQRRSRAAATTYRVPAGDGGRRRALGSRASAGWCSTRPVPLRMTGVCMDVTARKRAEQRVDLVLRELRHRVKNLAGMLLVVWRSHLPAFMPDPGSDAGLSARGRLPTPGSRPRAASAGGTRRRRRTTPGR